jgi:hypothetical protein
MQMLIVCLGKIVVDLLREFLEFYGFDATTSVFVPEANLVRHNRLFYIHLTRRLASNLLRKKWACKTAEYQCTQR